jgi:hypothetical protein
MKKFDATALFAVFQAMWNHDSARDQTAGGKTRGFAAVVRWMESSRSSRSKNHLVWIGFLVSVAGLVSYFFVFARFPALRDVPVLNIALVAVGVALSVGAVWRRRSVWSVLGVVGSLLCAGLLLGYVFVLSESLPDTTGVVAIGDPAPGFALKTHLGETVRLEDFRGRPLVLIFYRGFW